MTLTRWALATFAGDDPWPGLVRGDDVLDLRTPLGPDVSVRALIDDWPLWSVRLQELADHAPRGGVRLAGLRPLPPVLPCGQVFQAAANYRRHVLELLAAAERRGDASDGLAAGQRDSTRAQLDARARYGRPFVFLGSAHAMVGAGDDIVLPSGCEQPDWELELAAVIGRPARDVPRERALDAVAGYLMCNDVTARDRLARSDAATIGLDWLSGKNAPTFLPAGPLFVPAEHAGDPMDLRIRLAVNGRVMQDESTADMLFDVASLVAYISSVAELRPGDVVLTGSPAGNGAAHGVFLRPGDVVEGEITGLGRQRNRCVAAA